MENKVGTTGGSVVFDFNIEATEAGKWFQGNFRVKDMLKLKDMLVISDLLYFLYLQITLNQYIRIQQIVK